MKFEKLASAALAALLITVAPAARAQLPAGVWQYHWGDEFGDTALDTMKWSHNYPWGATHNHDAYMDPQNVVLGDGTLTLVAQRVAQGGKPFTSGAISSGYNRFTLNSGYIEARIDLPDTPGSWPAFWGLFDGWPPEADIMEYPLRTTETGSGYHVSDYHTAFHYTNPSGSPAAGAGKIINPLGTTPTPTPGDDEGNPIHTGYHTFGMEWREDDWVGFYFNGQLVSQFGDDTAIAQMQQMYLILNYAVGGWPGAVGTDVWPVDHSDEMKVDWVRVWKPGGESTTDWSHTGASEDVSWDSPSNWSGGSPNQAGVTAQFGAVPATEQRVSWGGIRTLSAVRFDGATRYQLGSASSRLLLAGANNASGEASITVDATSTAVDQSVGSQLELYSNTSVANHSAQPLKLTGSIRGHGDLTLTGNGRVEVSSGNNLLRGEVRVDSGVMALTNFGAFSETPRIHVASGATIDVLGLRESFFVREGQTLDIDTGGAVVGSVFLLDGALASGGGTVSGGLIAETGATVRVGGDGRVGEVTPVFWDDFSTPGLDSYTETRILDQGSTDNVSFANVGGVLQAASNGADGAEQTVLLREDFTLAIGQELRADAAIGSTADRDLGIMVAATDAPTPLTRSDYAMIFLRNSSTQIGSSGFDGATELNLIQVFSGSVKETLFIARTSANTFELGYYEGGSRTVVATRTLSNASVGEAFGFYSDLRENGTISGLDNLRIIDPNHIVFSSSVLSVAGDFTQSPGAVLEVDLYNPSDHDVLDVQGMITAGGVLRVSLGVGAPSPGAGDTFDVLDFASLSGVFDAAELPTLDPGLVWDTSLLGTTGELIVAQGIPGDFNGDGAVDAADYTVWRDSEGDTGFGLAADANHDFRVSQLDYAIWVQYFGATGGTARSVSITPEPSGVLLCSAVLLSLSHHRQRGGRALG